MHQHWNRWRRVNGSIASLTVGLSIATAGFPHSARAAELTGWQFDPTTQQLQVTVPAGTTPRYFLLAQPARIVLDLPNTQVGNVAAQQSYGGAVRQIRVGQFDATSTRIVIELSPDAEFAPGQVELQQASAATGGTQWVLRPLLTDGTADSPIAAQPSPAIALPVTPSVETAPLPAIAPSVPPAAPPAIAPPVPPSASPPAMPSLPNAAEIPIEPSAAASLPPLEPNAIEIPVDPAAPSQPTVPAPAAAPFQAEARAIDPIETTVLPSDSATSTIALNSPPAPSATLPAQPAAPTLPARDPVLLPPAADAPAQPTRVQVPPIASPANPVPAVPPQPQAAAPPVELPPALPPVAPANQVTVPPLNSSPPDRPAASPSRTVEFGQPPAEAPLLSARRSSVLLPAGTVLSLRYPRETAIEVESGQSRQEVLVLQTAVRNPEGEVVLPAGTQVIGRFETDRSGSRFVAQALSIDGRNLRLSSADAATERDRDISNDDLLVHSALGALALTVLGGFSGLGLIGGAAAGAATTYLASPEPIVIQPNQVFEVRLSEDLLR